MRVIRPKYTYPTDKEKKTIVEFLRKTEGYEYVKTMFRFAREFDGELIEFEVKICGKTIKK